SDSVPLGPLMLMLWPWILAATPLGTTTAFLPIRDMFVPPLPGSEHRAEQFAADICVAGVVVGHDALRRRQDGDAEAVVDARQVADRHVDAAAGLRYPVDFADHRLAVEILQLDLKLAASIGMIDLGVATDETFVLEHVEHADAQPRARRRDLGLLAHLRV